MKRRRSVCFMLIGAVLLVSAFGLTAANLMEEQRAEESADHIVNVFQTSVFLPQFRTDQESPDDRIFNLAHTQMVKIDGKEYIGILEIPELDVTVPVLNEWSNSSLKTAPCRYAGSYLEDSMIIAGHNYKKHFGGLSKLQVGDEIFFTDVFDTVFRYQVSGIEILDGSDVNGMEEGNWDLTLFTCNYSGAKRMTVRCRAM